MFDCDGDPEVLVKSTDTKCWESGHSAMVALAVPALLILTLGAVVKAGFQNLREHEEGYRFRVRRDMRYWSTKFLFYRLIVIVIGARAGV